MDSYIDIQVLPDPEMGETLLMNNLFAKFHRALVQLRSEDIAASFPLYGKTLGATLRIHGAEQRLQILMAEPWLKGLRDYCRIQPIMPIPSNVTYRHVTRVQAKSAHNKRQRSIAKGWLTPEEANHRIPDTQQKALKHPYVQLHSGSTGQLMRLYILQLTAKESTQGAFNRYGLSRTASVPWF